MTAHDRQDPGATPEVLLHVDDLAVHFGGVKAVDGLTMSVPMGLISGIIGPNGSGKSTFIAALTRLVSLTRGQMVFDGAPLHTARASEIAGRGIARTFQTVRLLDDLTIEENIRLGADAGQVSSRGRGRRLDSDASVAEALELTGIADLRHVHPGELSYGTQRRVEIARAIAMKPKLLLLDEPTAGMNQQERAEITALMRSLRSDGLTQLLVEHDVPMMLTTCDHLFAMSSGQLLAEGTPEHVVRDPKVREAYLGRKGKAHAADH